MGNRGIRNSPAVSSAANLQIFAWQSLSVWRKSCNNVMPSAKTSLSLVNVVLASPALPTECMGGECDGGEEDECEHGEECERNGEAKVSPRSGKAESSSGARYSRRLMRESGSGRTPVLATLTLHSTSSFLRFNSMLQQHKSECTISSRWQWCKALAIPRAKWYFWTMLVRGSASTLCM